MATKKMLIGKVKGLVLAEFEGLTISGSLRRAKRTGRDRLWIQIRQKGRVKRWRLNTSLSYARAADIMFVDDPNKEE